MAKKGNNKKKHSTYGEELRHGQNVSERNDEFDSGPARNNGAIKKRTRPRYRTGLDRRSLLTGRGVRTSDGTDARARVDEFVST